MTVKNNDENMVVSAAVTDTDEQVELNRVQKVGLAMQRYAAVISTCLLGAALVGSFVFAGTKDVATNTTADEMWDDVMGLLTRWVTRLGLVIIFVGGVMFGLGWRSDDAEQKSRGISTMIAGAIVAGITVLVNQFLLSSSSTS